MNPQVTAPASVDFSSYLPKVKIPEQNDKIYKDECVLSFDTPESESGLYICLNTYLGYGSKFVDLHYRRTGNDIFLHIKRFKKEKPKPTSCKDKQPTKLAIGIEGGFPADNEPQYEYEDVYSIVLLPSYTCVQFPSQDLPDLIQVAVSSLIAAESAFKLEEQESMAGTWDGEIRQETKHANTLVQLNNNIKIPPQGWKCDQCDMTENLWINLTDGTILCGRKMFDGSGGNNHAKEYYERTRYPLVVKLGTITSVSADVYSYDEDDMVVDPKLPQHLAHFGINIAQLEKTDKTMIELEIDMNQRIGEWALIEESGSQLVPIFGSGYTGLANLGNSCYLNSVIQVMFLLPPFIEKYYHGSGRIFDSCNSDPTQDFSVQMSKLGSGLLSGDYSKQLPNPTEFNSGIKPQMFKNIVGRGHHEFSSKRQQDAQEFFLHLMKLLERSMTNDNNPGNCFKFEVEERIQCISSKKVKYTKRTDFLLSLPIPLEAATNKEAVVQYEAKKQQMDAAGQKPNPGEIIRPVVPLITCLEAFAADEILDEFYSTAIQGKTTANKLTRFCSFPDYLMIQLKKFTVGEDWTPKKLDVSIDVPDKLNLDFLRGHGLQLGEEELPEKPAEAPQIQVNLFMLNQLIEMGFPTNACQKALYNADNNLEGAMNWLMEHISDPDYDAPLAVKSRGNFIPNDEALSVLSAMGFTHDQCLVALKATDNNAERAVDWIFSHPEEISSIATGIRASSSPPPQPILKDGPENYELIAFISHMGTSTFVGHYVCHIKRDGKWVIYNDNKVAPSENPPKDLAYLYLYKRT